MDLFQPSSSFTRIALHDADVRLLPAFLSPTEAAQLQQQLIAQTPWRCDEIFVWGKRHLQPRLVAWYSDEGCRYTYSGIQMQPLPWTPLLADLKARVEQACEAHFNSVLLNYYRNERDSMGMHSDDEPELGPQPCIASLSLGEERVLSFASRGIGPRRTLRLPLPSGSLLLMQGDTQHHWKHGIAKSTRHMAARVNLTFRRILPPA
ncbi:Alkylated DNA repair dioxygenase AlkB [Solimonas aquatica]|uniref:Alkylated DNA repair dioxygenase AlkB n=1 Tax=Solimonas aquatica TaxID=489703 RepID=A0A1H9KIY3_9GAMM|nr:alpha-ketoglutarate-dependent dioxygenase AlkB [Solimonas aquatica]SEQ98875.1 Alkylated DNA repair dioxygenase AlkB [Solimonas aquatica]